LRVVTGYGPFLCEPSWPAASDFEKKCLGLDGGPRSAGRHTGAVNFVRSGWDFSTRNVLPSTKYRQRVTCMAIKGRNDTMTTMATRIALGAGLAAGLAMVVLNSPAFAKDKYECMTDDGYGRKRSCSASYKAEHSNWRGTDDCYTDDGYGRKRSCSASYKAKHQK